MVGTIRVKVCGVRTEGGADAVARSGADYAGLLFVRGRRRAVTVEAARALIERLGAVEPVGVFMDEELEDVRRTVRALGLSAVQLHGREPAAYAEALKDEGLFVIRALSVKARLEETLFSPHRDHVDAFILDGLNPGSGKLIDESLVTSAGPKPSDLAKKPVWLAGGLNPENVAEALLRTRAEGVDVASGVEVGGAQDADRIGAFVRAARGAQRKDPS